MKNFDERRNVPLLRIHNVVTTADIKQTVDITRLNSYDWGIYDMEFYGGSCGYVKTRDMKGKVTVFLTGKLISVGANSIKDSKNQLKKTIDLLNKNNLISKVEVNTKVQNIVATLDIKTTLDIEKLSKQLDYSILNKKNFPALIYKTEIGPTCLIFSSGKIVINGSKSINQLNKVIDIFFQLKLCNKIKV